MHSSSTMQYTKGSSRKMKILLTGGAGFIGSHTTVEFISHGHDVVILDNFSNADPSVVLAIETLMQRPVPCIAMDVRDQPRLENVLRDHSIDAVIHFAGLKAVGDSVRDPIEYYKQNVDGALSLLEAMRAACVKTLVFSSSATVYGDPNYLPLDESHPLNPTNPYGRTKFFVEQIMKDLADADPEWKMICLRYFNPVGAHPSGLLGESPNGIPNNLMPFIAKVASRKIPKLEIFGSDYDTVDGSGVRDYIHVCDIAEGHRAALQYVQKNNGWHAINLGTGKGTSVLELINEFQLASSTSIFYEIVARRSGDVASCYADALKAKELLGWESSRNLKQMCEDAWRWESVKQKRN